MRNFKVTFCLSLCLLFACKKEDKKVDDPGPGQTPIVSAKYDAFIIGTTFVSSWNTTPPTIGVAYNVWAYFMSVPSETMSLTLGVNRGDLFVNSTKLRQSYYTYMDTTGKINLTGDKTVQLQSNGSFPSFSFSYNDPFPNFSSNYDKLINDTISKSSDYIIPLTGLNEADEIKCTLLGTAVLTKIVAKGTSQAVFKSSELSVLKAGEIVNVNIELRKYNRQTIEGKSFQFESNTNGGISATVIP